MKIECQENRDNLQGTWQDFMKNLNFNANVLRQEIAASWQRSLKAGINPYLTVASPAEPVRQELQNLLSSRRELIEVARPVINSVFYSINYSDLIIMLADEEGNILEVTGDKSLLEHASKIHLVKGSNWSEKIAGTNGLGTALHMKRPIQILGAEHFRCLYHNWCCSAAPIYNNHGKIIGGIQISEHPNASCNRSLGIVVASAEAISNRLKLNAMVRYNNNFLNIFSEVLHSVKDPGKNNSAASKNTPSYTFKDIIGKSTVIKEALKLASIAAESNSHVLIHGESGTGKEVFAQAIHNQSFRRSGPFVAINCGAIPRELIESELFGYDEGTFTGSLRGGKKGKFELASGGTIFLDEIGEMPLEQQVMLLRVLQNKSFMRLGGNKLINADVRIICATNKNLHQEVNRGNFRQDLFYRLNVLEIPLPPLRQRQEDIALLFNHLLSQICQQENVAPPIVDPQVMDILEGYAWPGNVRELQNIIEKMLSLSNRKHLQVHQLPAEIFARQTSPDTASANSSKEQINLGKLRNDIKNKQYRDEKEEIVTLLYEKQGNISQVARELNTSRQSVYRKLKKMGVQY